MAKLLIKIFLLAIAIAAVFLFFGKVKVSKNIIWGVNFSQKHAEALGLDWREVFLAILDDLRVKYLRIPVYWDLVESSEGSYDFSDLDWMMSQAEKRNTEVILVIGLKTPRWPECHIPQWAEKLKRFEQQEKILNLDKEIVLRYEKAPNIRYWQVENEPFFPFGKCLLVEPAFVKKEVSLVKSLDSSKRPVIISDSGEGSLWFTAANIGDIVGITMYRKIWFKEIGVYFNFPLPSVFYSRRAQLINKLFGKKVINIEFQAEPWCPVPLERCSLEEQKKTMDLEQLKKNIEFAKNTGLEEFYLWGAEWWYWLKEKGQPEFWEEIKGIQQN